MRCNVHRVDEVSGIPLRNREIETSMGLHIECPNGEILKFTEQYIDPVTPWKEGYPSAKELAPSIMRQVKEKETQVDIGRFKAATFWLGSNKAIPIMATGGIVWVRLEQYSEPGIAHPTKSERCDGRLRKRESQISIGICTPRISDMDLVAEKELFGHIADPAFLHT